MSELFLDTSSQQGLISLTAQCECVEERVFTAGKEGGGKFLPLCKLLLDKHHLQVSDLKAIFVGVGPGSFTGVRVAVSVAQAFAQACDIPIFSVSSLAFYAPSEEGKFAVLHDARRGDAYVLEGEVLPGGEFIYGEPFVAQIVKLAKDEAFPRSWISPDFDLIEAWLSGEDKELISGESVTPSAKHLRKMAKGCIENEESRAKIPLSLQYLRGVVLPKSKSTT